ncbi:AraC family transcriptional regulator [Vibrio cholerae]|uniref:AraC family transcriptional regulator n=1 Tax=Vibrio cholerae TaxID=666 RepID=UPI0002A29F0D|nr:AraC family transcriptional regulator [Vibrio cholerae]EKY30990.1 transcriptional regulator, AraC family protein [Vibrio cholerae PS15]
MMYNLGDSDIVEMEKSTSYNLKVDTMTFILNKDGNEINIILDNDETFHSKKNEILVILPSQRITLNCKDIKEIKIMEIRKRCFEHPCSLLSNKDYLRYISGLSKIHAIPATMESINQFHSLFDKMKRTDEVVCDIDIIECSNILVSLLIEVFKSCKKTEQSPIGVISRKVLEKIIECPYERWSLSMMAKELYMSESTLKRKLKSEDQTFTELYNFARMSHAKKLLLSNRDIKIATVAEMCGFNHVSYFVSCFKKYFGLSPLVYKKSLC